MSRKKFVTWLLILVALPWPIDYWRTRVAERKDRRDEELFRRHECGYDSPCAADFDRDGVGARFDILQPEAYRPYKLIVSDGGREVLRLPYHNIDYTLRTHLAVHEQGGAARLLVYDGTERRPPVRAVYAWSGGRLVEATPDAFDIEILDALAAYDDTGTFNERVFRSLISAVRFVAYYLLLLALAGIMLWGKLHLPDGPPPHTRDNHWLLRDDR
ncbi:MAG TPA: hypothetical protein VF064_18340 [Pyrinomonadaceae bacterium]